jgi:hypothetical protein
VVVIVVLRSVEPVIYHIVQRDALARLGVICSVMMKSDAASRVKKIGHPDIPIGLDQRMR